MLENKILGIFKTLEAQSFTSTDISTLTNSKITEVRMILNNLVRREKLVEEKKKFRLNQ